MRISDWSSDVCSSDLLLEIRRVLPRLSFARLPLHDRAYTAILYLGGLGAIIAMYFLGEYSVDSLDLTTVYERRAETIIEQSGSILRSEERRVGKECVSTCRSRWSPYH